MRDCAHAAHKASTVPRARKLAHFEPVPFRRRREDVGIATVGMTEMVCENISEETRILRSGCTAVAVTSLRPILFRAS